MARGRSRKAGLSGLLLCGAVALASVGPSAAEPVPIEVVGANMAYDRRTNAPIVTFRMSEASSQAFAALTEKNVGKTMHVKLDGRVVMSPVIREPIRGGLGQISGRFTVEQARDIAQRLKAGKATLEFEIAPD